MYEVNMQMQYFNALVKWNANPSNISDYNFFFFTVIFFYHNALFAEELGIWAKIKQTKIKNKKG